VTSSCPAAADREREKLLDEGAREDADESGPRALAHRANRRVARRTLITALFAAAAAAAVRERVRACDLSSPRQGDDRYP